MNFGYFWVFWRIFFGYTGIPLPPLADPEKWPVQENQLAEKVTKIYQLKFLKNKSIIRTSRVCRAKLL